MITTHKEARVFILKTIREYNDVDHEIDEVRFMYRIRKLPEYLVIGFARDLSTNAKAFNEIALSTYSEMQGLGRCMNMAGLYSSALDSHSANGYKWISVYRKIHVNIASKGKYVHGLSTSQKEEMRRLYAVQMLAVVQPSELMVKKIVAAPEERYQSAINLIKAQGHITEGQWEYLSSGEHPSLAGGAL